MTGHDLLLQHKTAQHDTGKLRILNINVLWRRLEQLASAWIVWSNRGLGNISICLEDKKLHKMYF